MTTDDAPRAARRQPWQLVPSAKPGDFLSVPLVAAQASPWIEVTLVDGTIVRVPQHNLPALAAVLGFMRGQEMGGATHA